ncbi:tRNA (guanine(9)-N(1))-methyltransferase Trmt10A isoform X1 [Nomia melanderi]|uniref:tRNA (guanine(9)-N(1))-methyltransferase Trmt10A isoform X1 n=1 Tax=Nomia melanderi TaxID=2448451 RepID=UPI0013042B13|nr:tRNA methyltransferase 10 homolog A isoform X1 [Nomia melanderi]XP_031838522.1 tRNA methyltransferase 10 homolog A isoform X1 [Nomia melanderi]XP_031838523.1 tRNA methyltransferase 10 homolog A isoform X1 [Nomia melanderi]XP_031838524.1 tRNA methyltransferase 10 homolog A isoform X1 [Nomia melanderi]XP_031838525.1 tRNA methyltransferase 10 homolog A isoform X1 [Nomia melanderi]XP_031838526.1 tRNA methyltransferase 10 homolog A isoform X1 [Nomia melanderi]
MENEKNTNNSGKTESDEQGINIPDCEDCHNVDKKCSMLNTNMSKRQLKKIKRREKWLERKSEKRLKEREKARQKRAYARANNISLGPSRKALKKSTMADSSCKIEVSIDMSFDDLMIDKDIAKLTKQILRCYTLNRRALAPMQFSVTGFNGTSRTHMQKHNGYQHWDVKFYVETYLDIYPKEKIIYLTSESENVINHLEHDCVYVIGGLVDHNSHKGLCHKVAKQAGVRHGRLPLDKFLEMKARKVLTVDHVFEILLRVSEGETWQEAFLQVLPERKNAQPILSSKESESALNICEKETNDETTEHISILEKDKNTLDIHKEENIFYVNSTVETNTEAIDNNTSNSCT